MSRFWPVVTIVFLVALVLLALHFDQGSLNIHDLETECRFDSGQSSNIGLSDAGAVTFNGAFFVDNPDSELDYGYTRNGGQITLNVRASNTPLPDSYVDNCKGIARYSASTEPLPPGSYTVTLQHNGKTVKEQVISTGSQS